MSVKATLLRWRLGLTKPHDINFKFNPWAIDVITNGGIVNDSKWPYAEIPHIRLGFKIWAIGMWWFLYLRFYRA